MDQNELTGPLTIRTLLALFAADVDIFLLKEEDQETDKDQVFTVGEIQEQLIKTIDKLNYNLRKLGYDLDQPLGGRIPIDPYTGKPFTRSYFSASQPSFPK